MTFPFTFFFYVPRDCNRCCPGGALNWYHTLTKAEQDYADRLGTEYAMRVCKKGLDQLTVEQLSRVIELVRNHFRD